MYKKELDLIDRPNDLWLKDDMQYAITMMFTTNSPSETKPRFITGGPYKMDTVVKRLKELLNSAEQERFVCLNSQFINPKNVISIKVQKWKDKEERDCTEGNFYE